MLPARTTPVLEPSIICRCLLQESEILTNFNQLREQVRIISSKCNDIEAECSEHEQVLKALQPLDKSRKCYRLIGGVLVERTVGEVTPAVEGNCEQLRMVRLES